MTESSVRISIELEGIEATPRFTAAVEELAAATAEIVGEGAEVSGFSGDLDQFDLSLKTIRPGVIGLAIGVSPPGGTGSYSDGRGGTYAR